MRAGWSFSLKAVRIRGESTTLVPSYAAGLEDVVIETPDRGQSPNGRSRWSQSTHHPSITVPNPARGCDLYVFHLRITYPCRTKSSASPFCAFTYHPLAPRLRSARSRFRSLVVPLCTGSPRRSLFEFRNTVGVSVASRHIQMSFSRWYIPQPIYLVAISRNM